jgi:hypothetical protein
MQRLSVMATRVLLCSGFYLDGSQTLLAVPLLNTDVDVVLGIRGVRVLVSRIRKWICRGQAPGSDTGPEARSQQLQLESQPTA